MDQQTGSQDKRISDRSLSARIGRARRNGATRLDLSRQDLTQLAEALGQLSQLQELSIHNNQLTALPEALGQLTQLQRLFLGANQLTALPEALGQLSQLLQLDLSDNQLNDVPETFRRLTSLQELYLHGNEALGLPMEVLGPTRQDMLRGRAQPAKPSDILEYYFRVRGGRRPLNEAKLILMGRGAVGKTSIVQRLVDNQFDPNEKKTEGIQITEWLKRTPSSRQKRAIIKIDCYTY